MFILVATFDSVTAVRTGTFHFNVFNAHKLEALRRLQQTTDGRTRAQLQSIVHEMDEKIESSKVMLQTVSDYTKGFWGFFQELRRAYAS